MERVIIVGGGLAGVRSAEALRAQGYAGRLTLLGAERHLPYDRPPLSKAVLMGLAEDTTVDVDWTALECELVLGHRATGLRLDHQRGGSLETTEGPLDFDGLVIATGAAPIRLPGDGPQHVLRTIDDARTLRASFRDGAGRGGSAARVVIVGAGWIGAEVATAAARAGCRVTVVEAADAPLSTAIGCDVGGATARWYAEAGVELLVGRSVASVDPGGLSLSDGESIGADMVVTGVGVRPEVAWLGGHLLVLHNGVVVDEALRARHLSGSPSPDGESGDADKSVPSSRIRPDIVAVGDCAAWWSRRFGRRLRVEHWDTALNAPAVAATSLLGRPEAYDPVPYFWSEQFGRMVQYTGHHPAGDQVVYRGDPTGEGWAACWLAGDRLVAILTVDRPRDLRQARRLISAGGSVDVARLADPDVAVRDVVRGSGF